MAGLSPVVDSNRVARLGIQSSGDSTTVITTVTPGSAYAEAGGLVGDVLVSVGEIDVSTQGWAVQFRSKYKNEPEGTTIPVVVRRAGERLSLPMSLRFVTIVSYRLLVETNASPSAVRIRQGIMTGAVAP